MAGPHPTLFERNASLQQIAKSYYIFLFQAPLLPEIWLSAFDWRIGNSFTEGYMKCRTEGAVSHEDVER